MESILRSLFTFNASVVKKINGTTSMHIALLEKKFLTVKRLLVVNSEVVGLGPGAKSYDLEIQRHRYKYLQSHY
jgi:hypothetical protein